MYLPICLPGHVVWPWTKRIVAAPFSSRQSLPHILRRGSGEEEGEIGDEVEVGREVDGRSVVGRGDIT